jgi:hypothetical protein
MVNSKSVAESPMPYLALYNQCLNALKRANVHGVYVSWLMAIAFKESHANAFFRPADLQFHANLRATPYLSDLARGKWLDFIRVQEGPFKGQIPKFRFERCWQRAFLAEHPEFGSTNPMCVVNACSWGIGQTSGLYYLAGVPLALQEARWRVFVSDPDMQLQQAAADLQACLKTAKGDVKVAFSMYNAGSGCTTVSAYGEIAYGLSWGFGEEIALRQLPQNACKPGCYHSVSPTHSAHGADLQQT